MSFQGHHNPQEDPLALPTNGGGGTAREGGPGQRAFPRAGLTNCNPRLSPAGRNPTGVRTASCTRSTPARQTPPGTALGSPAWKRPWGRHLPLRSRPRPAAPAGGAGQPRIRHPGGARGRDAATGRRGGARAGGPGQGGARVPPAEAGGAGAVRPPPPQARLPPPRSGGESRARPATPRLGGGLRGGAEPPAPGDRYLAAALGVPGLRPRHARLPPAAAGPDASGSIRPGRHVSRAARCIVGRGRAAPPGGSERGVGAGRVALPGPDRPSPPGSSPSGSQLLLRWGGAPRSISPSVQGLPPPVPRQETGMSE